MVGLYLTPPIDVVRYTRGRSRIMTAATLAGSGSPVDASMTPGEDSAQSSGFLRNLSSKIVKGLDDKKNIPHGAECISGHGGTNLLGATNKAAGGVGFVGSMLGEVLISYSTSTLPSGKRHSISATSAHYEELAAEAGIDLDADEINMEGVHVGRLVSPKYSVAMARYPRKYGKKKSDEEGV